MERHWQLEAGKSRETQSLEIEEKAMVKEDVQSPEIIISCSVGIARKTII
jgi:hypothetical protein